MAKKSQSHFQDHPSSSHTTTTQHRHIRSGGRSVWTPATTGQVDPRHAKPLHTMGTGLLHLYGEIRPDIHKPPYHRRHLRYQRKPRLCPGGDTLEKKRHPHRNRKGADYRHSHKDPTHGRKSHSESNTTFPNHMGDTGHQPLLLKKSTPHNPKRIPTQRVAQRPHSYTMHPAHTYHSTQNRHLRRKTRHILRWYRITR